MAPVYLVSVFRLTCHNLVGCRYGYHTLLSFILSTLHAACTKHRPCLIYTSQQVTTTGKENTPALTPLVRLRIKAIAQFYGHTLHSLAQATSWRALEAELSLLIIVPHPHAPRALSKASIGGVVLAPLGHELLEVAGALHPHPSRSVRLHRREQPRVAQPLRSRQRTGVFGREESGK
eukprot:scaffold16214_cov73-Phaeocystis_antarctica.AAC.10